MRVCTSEDSHAFEQWLLNVSYGQSNVGQNLSTSVSISDVMYSQSQSNLIESVYGTISNSGAMPSPKFFHERAILAPRNDDIHTLNLSILALLPGNKCTYTSANSSSIDSPTQHQNTNIPVEFLHTLNVSGLPIAHLQLKVGCPIILLCNIDTK